MINAIRNRKTCCYDEKVYEIVDFLNHFPTHIVIIFDVVQKKLYKQVNVLEILKHPLQSLEEIFPRSVKTKHYHNTHTYMCG